MRGTSAAGRTVDVVVPCLNEAAALPWVLSRMPADYSAIVVDNGSTDASATIAESFGATVVPAAQRGYGAACIAGLQAARTEIVCFLDGDATLDPGELPLLVAPVYAGAAQLALGRRRPTTPRAWPAHARLANAYLCARLRRQFDCPVGDLSPMRAARRVDLLGLGVTDVRFGYPLQTLVRAGQAGWAITEIDVRYRPRTGRSKVTGTVRGTFAAIRDMRRVLANAPGARADPPRHAGEVAGARTSQDPAVPPLGPG